MNDDIKLMRISPIDATTTMLTLHGEVDYGSLGEVREEAYQLVGDTPMRLLVDLRQVSFIDSNGLGFLLSMHKRIREKGGQVVLISTNKHIEKLLKMSGLSTIFDVFADDTEALQGLSK